MSALEFVLVQIHSVHGFWCSVTQSNLSLATQTGISLCNTFFLLHVLRRCGSSVIVKLGSMVHDTFTLVPSLKCQSNLLLTQIGHLNSLFPVAAQCLQLSVA